VVGVVCDGGVGRNAAAGGANDNSDAITANAGMSRNFFMRLSFVSSLCGLLNTVALQIFANN